MFIVVPYLSSDQTTYGIYSVCISVTIFLAYADLGFLGAAQKYAAESFAQNDTSREVSLIGFAHFILLVVVLLICGVFLYMSFHPENLISGLSDPTQREIAHKLLLILAISAPVMVLQRMLQMIFGIRLEEYNIQKIVIIGNVLKIASIFYFFTGGRYDIVGYYLFMQIVAVMVALTGLWMARRKYNYPFKLLFTKFKFSKTIFAQTKSLAFSSLFVTAAWILYYELDSIAIGKMLGAKMVAIYAIGLTLLGFIRSLLGVFFSPFSSRFNHFIGLGKIEEFKTFYLHVIKMTFPLVVFPLTAAAMMSRGLIVSWVGVEYNASVDVAVWLILCNVLGFISYPAGVMLVAREKIKQMYLVNAAMVVVFWGGILLTIGSWGVESFAVFKFITFTLSAILYVWLSIQFLGISFAKFLRQVVLPHLPALILIIVVLYFVQNICIDGKSKLSLLINASIVVGAICVGFCVSFITSKDLRNYVTKTAKTLFKK